MKCSTLIAAALLCISGTSGRRSSASPAIHKRYHYDPFRARGLQPRQENQRCGAENNEQVCSGQSCCSMYGWCGEGPEYCNRFSCQTEYGWCDGEPIPTSTSEPEPEPEPTEVEPTDPTTDPTTEPGTGETLVPEPPELLVSEDGLCGNVTTCAGSTFGRCCSDFYWCGNDEAYCGDGCREEFGSCGDAPEEPEPEPEEPEPEPEPEEPPQTELVISSDGMCGNGTTCAGSDFGGCCSWYFWCGDGEPFCGDSCRTEFGSCDEPEPEEPPQTELEISTTGMCGNGTTCAGSDFGGCCSWWFWCGTGSDFCAGDCRPEFGECETVTEV